jgi:hypothetical protein
MIKYVIFDANGNFSNIVVGDEFFIPPDNCTAQAIPQGYEWNGTEIIKIFSSQIEIETI